MFLPQTPETLSRVVVEARMLGCSVITNNMIGATQEPWFDLKKDNLIDYMIKKRLEIVSTIEGLITPKIESDKSPLVSIITTFCNAEKNLEHFMNNIVNQTIFDKCELIVVDAKSEGKERQILSKYLKKYDNIKYIRLEEKLLPTPCLNMAIKNCNGDFITFAFTDDVKKKDCIEILFKEIKKDNNISLVYGDVLLTNKQNETFLNNSSNNLLSEHSACEFSKQNMIKCLPGPFPMFKKSMIEKNGGFNPEFMQMIGKCGCVQFSMDTHLKK